MTWTKLAEWIMVSGVGYGFFTLVFDLIRARFIARKVKGALVTAEAQSDAILDQLVNDTNADYAQVVRVHNSGGDLETLVPIFMTVVKEFKRPSFEKMAPIMQGVAIGQNYRKLIGELLEKKTITSKAWEVEDNMAAGIYDLMGAKCVVASLIRVTKKDLVFLRVTTEKEEFEPHEEFLISAATSRLKKTYR